jgi:hypothetical protein
MEKWGYNIAKKGRFCKKGALPGETVPNQTVHIPSHTAASCGNKFTFLGAILGVCMYMGEKN